MEGETRRIGIWGLGGAGKSQLARSYLRRYRADDNATFWIEAGQTISIDRDFLQIYHSFANAPSQNNSPSAEEVLRVVHNIVGLPLYLEVQYLDITTCLPVPEIYVDVWNCNATGVYGGINVTGNVADGGYESTILRGIQPTDDDGVVSFETIFPGHYSGRAIHIHLLAHSNVTVFDNNTISTGAVSNADDMWSIVQAENDYDSFPEFLCLDADDITQDLFAWFQIGINVMADQTSSSYYGVAAVITEDGVTVSSSTIGGDGDDGGDFNGTAPTNGTAPPGAPSA